MAGAAGDRVSHERRRRRPTRSGTLLSAGLIVDCALRLIGEHGPEALSVRRLGAALGCDPSAVYRYFHNTDDLLLAVADRIIGQSMEGFIPGPDWVGSLREMALRVRDSYRAHPRAAALASHRVTRRENEFRAVETGVGILVRAGFEPARALRLYLAFIDTVLGHAALDAAALALPPAQRQGDSQASTRAYRSVSAETYPLLAALREDLDALAESSFEPALELMLSALAAQAPARPGT
ncbi:TetR/AcrR family transcriptional regulator [Streptomyces sp. BRA346]|uniref:TetR/AcrR family transcriptional regulator n=1 Tax=Streptomyces sp. BRA346 TaxID=2878199 RepID=UPI0040649343